MTVRSTYTVVGMTCGHCVQAVTAELIKVPGVHGVEVELSTGQEGSVGNVPIRQDGPVGQEGPVGLLSVDSDGPLPLDAVRAAVEEAGYELAGTHA
jgi:copper chaperone CopZ